MGPSVQVLTADLAESSATQGRCADPATGTEKMLAEVLAGVVRVERVPADSHFFDDLGADSLVMAQFCARVRKRADLPPVSMKDIYQHPTIRSLATALADAAATPAERMLAEVLAGVVRVERVPADSHFFDDLGADSLVMAQFCARVRKRADLPPVSMKDIYRHPTISSLAASLTDTAPAPAGSPVPAPIEVAAPASTLQYIFCGTLQFLFFLGSSYVAAVAVAFGYQWISAGSGLIDIYVRSVLFGGAAFLGLCALPILAKWVLIGRWKPQQIRIWSLAYVRFWIVKTLVRSNPVAILFAGSPLYVLYLRALGAKIGRGAAIFSRHAPICTDLLTIGAGTVIRKDSFFLCYRAHAGRIQTGAVTLGRDVYIGEKTMLDIGTSMGDGAQIGHACSLHAGQAVPGGERWHGSPAQRAEVDYRAAEPAGCGTLRRAVYTVLQLLKVLFVYLPLLIGGVSILLTWDPQLSATLGQGLWLSRGTFYLDALAASLVLFFGAVLAGLLVAFTVPRVLNLFIKPDTVYPLYGFRYSLHRAIARMTNIRFLTQLFGDSSYIVHYLRCLGYDLSRVVQTGSNFGCEVTHENPYLTSIGSGTMVADSLSIINADFSSTSFRVSRASIGPNNFLGNDIAYPSGGRTGDNCLLATKVMVPIDGEVREGVGLLGSPSFEIPRSVERDSRFDHLATGDELRRRLAAKNRYNIRTMGMFLFVRWLYVFLFTVLGLAAIDLYGAYAHAVTAAFFALTAVVTPVYFVLVERGLLAFRSLRPRYCSIYDPYFWRHERFWKVPEIAVLHVLDGTPFKNVMYRLLGVRLGRRVFDDGCLLTERTLAAIGDDCTLNVGSKIQCHSQEDGAFKSDRSTIGAGCTLGVGALVHYGVTMGDGAVLAPGSFLMKGEEVPQYARWGGTRPGRSEMTTISRQADQAGSAARNRPACRPAGTATTTAAPSWSAASSTVATVSGGEDSMGKLAEAGREFWRGVLVAGGFTAIPRWTLDPVAGVAGHEAAIPGDLVAALGRLADELAVPLSSVLLAAHAKVLAALSGEREVVTGYVAVEGGRPLPCRLTTGPGSWRAVLADTHRAESELLSHKDFPVDDLRRELGLAGPSSETVFDPAGDGGELAAGTVLRAGFLRHGGRLVLRLRYRTDVLDAGYAARIAGYHLTALALIAADPDAGPGRQSLLSAGEVRFQLDGLAGPRRELPDRRFHELFEQRAAAHPDAVAAVHGDRQLTYRELNARANRLGRALLARGLGREGVVAVVTERNLDWMAAVLAVFKAGGVYLPIEPHFPADRIATTLSRAGCGLVLTEPASTTTLGQALDSLPAVQTLFVDAACEEDHADGNLGTVVTPDQLAYIYFTSGSTGEPKGAMCEHAGMLNHLYAKIDALDIGAGQVVAQTAPQCFDISLWQLVSALLLGGRTLLVEQEAILDVPRFVDTIAGGRVAVLQVVPSYLEAVLSYLEQHPRELPDLRGVSVTGEALKKELTQRWFAAQPQIKLVNAYGLTETSDDTNHEVMDRVPDRDLVPLGPPVQNVHVYVVDEHLSPVPLGAPGAIVFSGVCVGRGYVNDPERTRLAYMADPHRPGQRLYRGGDYGRWQPEGKLEFLGRRDTQVKISGFRIEIGEIENTLLRVPGVRDGAVVIAGRPGQGQHLVAFYSGPRPLPAGVLRDRLAASLPGYMVPSAFHWRESLPLTANSKIDRKALTALAAEPGAGEDGYHPPGTPTEQRLAAAWAKVLGIPRDQIGRRDHFFDRGGTSLSAVKLAITLDRAVSLTDLTRHPVLADLAGLVDDKSGRRPGLLQPLAEPGGGPAGALVCFPYAGGNAVNFQPMASALRGSGLTVYAVELPGHDPAGDSEPFAPIAQVARQVAAEITRLGLTRVLLWGHSSGTALAVETAIKLQQRGVKVQRVFLGGQLPGDATSRRAAAAELTGRSDAEIAAELSADSGYTGLGELDAQRAGQVGAAYRHDCVSAHRYLADALDTPPAVRLSAPVTVVAAADDPATAESARRHRDWQLLAEHVDLHEITGGGHYFLRTRPAEAAQAVLRAAAVLARS